MSQAHLLIIEDEPAIRQLIMLGLGEKYSYAEQDSLAGAKAYLDNHLPSLIILDWMLPDGSGIALFSHLAHDPRLSKLPVIMLTARAAEADITKGLDMGADDYLTKPFSPAELASRVKALLRRTTDTGTAHLSFERIRINLTTFEAFYDEQPVKLHRREFNLLKTLLASPGKVLSRENLLDAAWGEETDISDRAVDVSIRRLRKAFEQAGYALPMVTIRGIGYRLEKPVVSRP